MYIDAQTSSEPGMVNNLYNIIKKICGNPVKLRLIIFKYLNLMQFNG